MLIEVRHACQTLWYHPHGSPSIPFFSNIKPITILQTHRAIYAAGPLNRFSPQLEYLSHSIAQIHLSHFYPFMKRNLTFFFLKQILNHPRVVEESQLCKRFLSGVLAFTTYTHTHTTRPLSPTLIISSLIIARLIFLFRSLQWLPITYRIKFSSLTFANEGLYDQALPIQLPLLLLPFTHMTAATLAFLLCFEHFTLIPSCIGGP